MSRFSVLLFALLRIVPPCTAVAAPGGLDLDPQVLALLKSSQEFMHFAISWSGGIKIGDLHLRLAPASDGGQVISAQVTDSGLFRLVYPVDDSFVTKIRGPLLLPEQYQVKQMERGRTVHRLTRYDQQRFEAVYQKQKQPVQRWQLNGPMHNEFSAFFISRALQAPLQRPQIVPVFVEKKRQPVPVKIVAADVQESIFGQVKTLQVQPKMRFKGLYDKDGDTVFWLTDDVCRVPIKITSKILIGSLTAELVQYSNPACPLHHRRPRK